MHFSLIRWNKSFSNHSLHYKCSTPTVMCLLNNLEHPTEDVVALNSCFQEAKGVLLPHMKYLFQPLGCAVAPPSCTPIESRRSLVCLQTGPVSTWKWYKSTVVQEAFAISSLLRHKRITVPLTQTTTTWDPVQHWNFPTDKNTLTV